MAMRYKVTIEVPAAMVGVVIDVLNGEGVLMSVEPVQPVQDSKRGSRYVNGIRNKGMSAADLIMSTLEAKHSASGAELEVAFAQHGFSRTSVSPSVARAIRAGKIVRRRDGRFIPTPPPAA